MTDNFSALSVDNLIEHESFVRAVARGLLRDEHDADDVTQDVLLRSLQSEQGHRPRSGSGLRAWIVTVTRNAARNSRRQDLRRAAREERAARAEEQESVALAFERLSLQREVVGEILALSEPYRTVVLLRYYHDLTPAEIAERLGAKPATVRTQLVRAHELLRDKLDSQHDRRAWSALLVPGIASTSASAAASRLPWTAVLVAAAAGIVAVSIWFATPTGSTAPLVAAPLASPHPSTLVADAPVELTAPAPNAREVIATAPPVEAPQTAPAAEAAKLFARAELFDRDTYRDREDAYERATFSFVHGLRDDPGSAVTRNDWDVLFGSGTFRTHTVVDDSGLIVDLGAVRLADLAGADQDVLRTRVAAAALVRYRTENHEVRGTNDEQPAVQGHTYFVWTRDSDTDEVAAFEVLEHAPRDRCLLEWYASKDGRSGRGSFVAPSGTAGVLHALRLEARAQHPLRQPRVRLQVRAGANGGNPNHIDMAGCAYSYVDRISTDPLDLALPVSTKEKVIAFAEAGFVPEGRIFVVTHVTYEGSARGDSNGPGGFRLVLAGQPLGSVETTDQAIQGAWDGNVEIAPGDERNTYLEVRNSSTADALFEGHWKP